MDSLLEIDWRAIFVPQNSLIEPIIRGTDRAAPGIVGRVRVNGRNLECLDVLAGTLPGKPMWIGEPTGLVVRELPAA